MLTQRRLATGLLVGATALTLALLVSALLLTRASGLSLDVETSCRRESRGLAPSVVDRIDAAAIPPAALASGCAQARWSGFWAFPQGGAIAFKTIADGPVRLSVDSQPIIESAGTGERLKRKIVTRMAAGLHAIAVEWTPGPAPRSGALRIYWGRRPGAWRPLEAALLFSTQPSPAVVLAARARPGLQRLALIAWLIALIAWGIRLRSRVRLCARALAASAQRTRIYLCSGWRPRALATSALALILLYGAALRLEALVSGYWPGAPPAWAQRVVSLVEHARPTTLRWSHLDRPYAGGDPDAYLRYARQMRNPYEPRVREPMFVMATKVGLWLTGNRDVGVSVASGLFSVLAIAVTYLLGAFAFSRWVGLGAALALAIEQQAIAQGVAGFRDEAFAVFVMLTAWAALRLYRRGAFCDALLLGFVGGGAWLTRITTPTLLLPLYLALAVFPRSRPWRLRLQRVGVAALVSIALIAPFMVNCAIVYGDPFYSINQHVVFYRVGSNLSYTHGMNVLDYLRSSFRPAQMADTVFIGYTDYPFGRKWSYGDWSPHLGEILATLSIAGMALWLLLPSGRLLLLVHAATMFAFAFSYEAREGGPWRLTFHAYPFYLIAAFLVAVWLVRWLVSRSARRQLWEWLSLRRGLSHAAAAAALVLVSWSLWHGLHYLRFAEALRLANDPGRPVGVFAGPRDAFFFAENWHPAVEAPGWPDHFVRYSRGRVATLRLPLSSGHGYVITLGLDPAVAELSPHDALKVDLNGRRLAALRLEWHPEKTGRYVIDVPALFVVDGANRLTLSADLAAPAGAASAARSSRVPKGWDTAFALSYVMVRPSAPTAAPILEQPPRASCVPVPPSLSPGSARLGL